MFWIPLAMMAAGAALAAYQAKQQNKALSATADSAGNAAGLQRGQVAKAAMLERQKRLANYRATLGRLRVAAAENGTGLESGSANALQQQEAHRSELDRKIITLNEEAGNLNIASQAEATIRNINNQVANPILSAFSGGLQGLSSGLAIESSVNEYQAANAEEARLAKLKAGGPP